MRRGVHFRVMQFFGLRHAFQHQHHRAPYRCYIDGLVRGVQHQHRLLHQRHAAGRYWRWESTAGGTLGAGHSRSACIGGMAPPGIDHAWPPCAHRAFLGYDPTGDVRRRSLKPRGPLSTRSPIWHLPRAKSSHTSLASLQKSLHHLPVRRVNCQPGCPDVWQKRHARIPSVLHNLAIACRGLLGLWWITVPVFVDTPGENQRCSRRYCDPFNRPPSKRAWTSLQMGIRVGSGSSCSQMRQPAGNTTLSNAARTIAEPSARNASRGRRIAARQSPQLSWVKFNCSARKRNYYLVI